MDDLTQEIIQDVITAIECGSVDTALGTVQKAVSSRRKVLAVAKLASKFPIGSKVSVSVSYKDSFGGVVAGFKDGKLNVLVEGVSLNSVYKAGK
jgi:hypothetical protein